MLNQFQSKGHITKVYSIKGVDLKICLGFFTGEGMPRFKKLIVLKTVESGNFKTVNYIVIGRFLTILWRFSQKNVVFNVEPKITTFARIATKPP